MNPPEHDLSREQVFNCPSSEGEAAEGQLGMVSGEEP